MTKQALALSATPTKDNSPVVEMSYSVESTDEGVFSVTTNTRYNAEGNPLVSVQKLLASHLSNAVKRKNLTIDERTCGRGPDWSFLFRRNMVDCCHAGNIRSHFSGLC